MSGMCTTLWSRCLFNPKKPFLTPGAPSTRCLTVKIFTAQICVDRYKSHKALLDSDKPPSYPPAYLSGQQASPRVMAGRECPSADALRHQPCHPVPEWSIFMSRAWYLIFSDFQTTGSASRVGGTRKSIARYSHPARLVK